MNQLSAMRMFAKVAESLSFAIAARELHVSAAMVTRGVAMLEAHLNLQLLNRTTRKVALTEAGYEYWQGCRTLLQQLEMLEASVCSATRETAGSLKLAAHEFFAATGLSEMLTEYRAREPGVSFELTVFESTGELAAADFDVCFTAERRLRDSALVCRPLAQFRDLIVAAPSYLARRTAPHVPEDLPGHDVLLCADAGTRYWTFCDAYGTHRVPLQPIVGTSSLAALLRAARAGLGVARLPAGLIEAELRTGTLVSLLENFELENGERTLWMLYSGHRYMTQRVRRFVDFVAARSRHETAPWQGIELMPPPPRQPVGHGAMRGVSS